MSKQIVVYSPLGTCSQENQHRILLVFPNAKFVSSWEEGAVMWQTLIDRIERSAA